jgi:hypothetical protein
LAKQLIDACLAGTRERDPQEDHQQQPLGEVGEVARVVFFGSLSWTVSKATAMVPASMGANTRVAAPTMRAIPLTSSSAATNGAWIDAAGMPSDWKYATIDH